MLQLPKQQEQLKLKMMRDLYGPGLPACRQIETQILSKCAAGPAVSLLLLCKPEAQPLACCSLLTTRVPSRCILNIKYRLQGLVPQLMRAGYTVLPPADNCL